MSLITFSSPYNIKQTLEKLLQAITERELHIFAVINHSEAAQKASLKLTEEQVVIFGDPTVGTLLMQENPMIGIELPLKILVWQLADGSTRLAYQDPLSYQKIYNIQKHIEILQNMSKGLQGLMNEIEKR